MRRLTLNLVILLSVASALTAAAVAAEPSVFSWEYWEHGKRSEIFRNFALAYVAVFGLGFGIWRAWTAHRQANVSEQGLITDRFSKAVDQLGSDQLSVRLGGIYALWRLTEDAPDPDVARVLDILCAFVRSAPPESSGLRETGPNDAGSDPEESESVTITPLRPDVQTILHLIAEESANYRKRLTSQYTPNLMRANLARAHLIGTNLVAANLAHADLTSAHLSLADLSGAILMETKLTNAFLQQANLTGADFMYANLTGANLKYAKGLTQGQLDSACIEKGGIPPIVDDGLNPPANFCPESPSGKFMKDNSTW